MTQLQQARYDGLLRRVGDLKGGGSKVSEVLSEVFPVVDLENVPAELYALNGWRLGFASTEMPPLVANLRICQLFNPAGSNQIVVPTRISFSSNVAQRIEYDVDAGPLSDLFSSSIPRDTRRGVRAPLVAQLRQTFQPGGLAPQGQIIVQAAITYDMKDLDGLFVLGPGSGLNFAPTVVNTNLIFNIHWRERLAEPSELNF